MTAQAGELLLQNGKQVWMKRLPLEAYWEANPPRPYMIAESIGFSRPISRSARR